MSEAEFREVAWQSCVKRIIAEVEAYSSNWMESGPSKAAARAIVNKIRSMPVPVPVESRS